MASITLPPHKCGLYLSHNEHRDMYQSLAEFLADMESLRSELDWATETSKERCIATNELWQLQWYPDTPIGSYCIFGATLDEVLAAAMACHPNKP